MRLKEFEPRILKGLGSRIDPGIGGGSFWGLEAWDLGCRV